MDVRRCLLDEQAAELQQENAQTVARPERIFRIDNAINKHANDVVLVVKVGGRRSANERLALALLEAADEAWHDDVLQDLGLEQLWPGVVVVVEDVDELKERHTLPLDAEPLRDALLQVVLEELEVRHVAAGEAAEDVEEELDLVRVMSEA